MKHWKTRYAYFKYTTGMCYVPPPRKLRYLTDIFVIMGLVQRIDDVLLRHNLSWSLVSSQSWNLKILLLTTVLWNNVNDYLQLCSRLSRRKKLWCGRNALLTPISTWTRLDVSHLLFGTSEFCYRWAGKTFEFEDWRVEQLLSPSWKTSKIFSQCCGKTYIRLSSAVGERRIIWRVRRWLIDAFWTL